ncbi:hypothetical protein CRYUN_Cryun34aG0067000 [Craigia yunnanensis]
MMKIYCNSNRTLHEFLGVIYDTMVVILQVNRIRELPQNSNIVATHTDSPDVLIWDVEAQPNRHAVLGATDSRPDLSRTSQWFCGTFMIISLLWQLSKGPQSLRDLLAQVQNMPLRVVGVMINLWAVLLLSREVSTGAMRILLKMYNSAIKVTGLIIVLAQEFCSAGDDSCLILRDARAGSSPAVKVEKAHNADLHCVDWNPHDTNIILTGSADNTVHMFDRRNLSSGGVGSPVHIFEGHSAAVLCVQWSPDKSSVFGSSAEDGILNIWDHEKIGKKQDTAGLKAPNAPPGLLFRHAGHRYGAPYYLLRKKSIELLRDFHWNTSDPWTIVSVFDDCESTNGGGTLQIWRMIDLIYRPAEEVLAELDKFKSHILACEQN